MGIQSDSALEQAYRNIECCNIAQALVLLEETLKADLENKELVFALHCCYFWQKVTDSLSSLSNFEKAESLVSQWKQFKLLLIEKRTTETSVYAFKKGIFSEALKFYEKSGDEKDDRLRAEIFRKSGLCYKKLGSYEKALSCLTEANSLVQNQAAVLAEMADCYALCGESKFAKLLFREAFFVDAEKIDLDFLDSPLIKLLVEKVKEKGYTGQELLEWIPIYGVLLGVFNVKRELRSQEVLKLKQEIYAKKSELKNPANNSSLITPKLLNMYFWLIDHYVLSKESVAKIDEALLEIKILDKSIYNLYVK